MKYTLEIGEDRRGYYLHWVDEEGEEGAILGETSYTAGDLANATSDDWEHIKATLTASKTRGVNTGYGFDGFRWETFSDAFAARRSVKAALKDKTKRPWPEWAIKAKAAGWTPPKRWKP